MRKTADNSKSDGRKRWPAPAGGRPQEVGNTRLAMATNKELGAELTRRLRRLLGPTEAGPHGDAERYLGTMPRRNEPVGDFMHPETPVSEESLRRMAARPAEQFNMNAASAAGGRIKGIEGIAIEIDPDLAVTTFRKQTSENSRPTARSVAAGMLCESRRTRAALCTTLQGPGWAGSRRGWIEPGEAATAMTVALRNTDRSADGQANAWKHVSREQIQERSNGEDYDGYINALAEDTVPAGGGEDTETHAGAVRDAERAIEQQLGATIIEPGADVSTKAVIGRNVRIGTGTRVEADAHVGCTTGGLGTAVKNDESARRPTVVGEHARIGRKATVAAGARIGNRTAIGAYARVHSVGHDSRVGSDAWCRGPVGNETSIGRNAITHQVGNGCEIGEGAGVRRPVGNDVHVGRDTGIGLTVGHDNQERVPDGSRIGPEVHAPHGFRTVGNGAAQIAGGTHMGKGLTDPQRNGGRGQHRVDGGRRKGDRGQRQDQAEDRKGLLDPRNRGDPRGSRAGRRSRSRSGSDDKPRRADRGGSANPGASLDRDVRERGYRDPGRRRRDDQGRQRAGGRRRRRRRHVGGTERQDREEQPDRRNGAGPRDDGRRSHDREGSARGPAGPDRGRDRDR